MIEVSEQISELDIDDFCVLEGCILGGWTKQMLFDAVRNKTSSFLKAVTSGKTIGYINYSVVIDEAEINAVVTSEQYRRRGIARILIDKLVQKCTALDIKSIFLEVNENNLPAIRLYEKCGFIYISERKNYYNKESALIFRKQLQ